MPSDHYALDARSLKHLNSGAPTPFAVTIAGRGAMFCPAKTLLRYRCPATTTPNGRTAFAHE